MFDVIGKKRLAVILSLTVGYILLFAPYIYSVFYSMPANDDFPLGSAWWGGNILTEAFKRAGWNYMNWFGQSGLLAIIIQVLCNPFYWLKNAGHSFGICMVVVFVMVYGGILLAARRIIKLMDEDISNSLLDLFTFLLALLIFTCYYYNDVYNWWSAVPGYSLMMLVTILNIGNMIKYCNTHSKKDYIWMLVTGLICCTALMCCVTTGLFYLLFIFVKDYKSDDSIIKKIIPLLLYILSGVITVAAPGNSHRTEYEIMLGRQVETTRHYFKAAYVTVLDMQQRFVATLQEKPWVLLIGLLIIFVGIAANKNGKKIKLSAIVLGIIATCISSFGAVYPYVLANNNEVGAELAYRVYFMQDYILYIGFAVNLFLLGMWMVGKLSHEAVTSKKRCKSQILLAFVLGLWCLVSPGKTYFVPMEIVQDADIIQDNYYLWNGILEEIETSDEADVVVNRQEVTWSRYVYPCGLVGDDSSDWPVGDDIYYCGCNQAVARIFGKNSVSVVLE